MNLRPELNSQKQCETDDQPMSKATHASVHLFKVVYIGYYAP